MQITQKDSRVIPSTHELTLLYRDIKQYVCDMGFSKEIEWQGKIALTDIGESDFLRESAWVVLCGGMREAVIRDKFQDISICFFEWESAQEIVKYKNYCRDEALSLFGHSGKINAIISIAESVARYGIDKIKTFIEANPIKYLKELPFIGPVTSYHLAKNLGVEIAKPDRHLERISEQFGFTCVQKFVETIAKEVNDKISVVDIVLWRFASIRNDYLDYFLRNCARVA